jgi:methionyl-tRNA synthetase
MIANIAVLLEPFLPFSSSKIRRWLSIDNSWAPKVIHAGYGLPETEILFDRLDKSVIDDELERLHFLALAL